MTEPSRAISAPARKSIVWCVALLAVIGLGVAGGATEAKTLLSTIKARTTSLAGTDVIKGGTCG